MIPDYFDTHSHLNFSHYDNDREELIQKLKGENIHTITVGTDLENSRFAVELASKHENLYATVGIHPTDVLTEPFEEDEFSKLINNPKVVAVGECGLDYFRESDSERKKKQKEIFEKHIQFALRHEKPLMIHCRDAYDEIFEILNVYFQSHGNKLRGNMHFFAGTVDDAKKFLSIGFSLSFSGVITFARDYDEVILFAPKNMILAETDAPFVAPVPYRGRRNEPSYVKEVVKKIAEIRRADFLITKKALVSNARQLLNLKNS